MFARFKVTKVVGNAGGPHDLYLATVPADGCGFSVSGSLVLHTPAGAADLGSVGDELDLLVEWRAPELPEDGLEPPAEEAAHPAKPKKSKKAAE